MGELFQTVLSVSLDPAIAETGGRHTNKGTDFQRHWALVRMFELKQEGASDFLFLFEAIQDVAVLDSAEDPVDVKIYQVKKKDAGSWSISELTGLTRRSLKKSGAIDNAKVAASVVGKLYRAATAFGPGTTSNAYFVSNAGCELPLASGSVASSQLTCCFSALQPAIKQALCKGLSSVASGPVDLTMLHVQKTILHPDDPTAALLGKAYSYLLSAKPTMAAQAKSLVDALLVHVSRLSRSTQTCTTFEELRARQGLSLEEFDGFVSALDALPNISAHVEELISDLRTEGVPFNARARLRIAVTAATSRRLSRGPSRQETIAIEHANTWLDLNPPSGSLWTHLQDAVADIKAHTSEFADDELLALVAIEVIKRATT